METVGEIVQKKQNRVRCGKVLKAGDNDFLHYWSFYQNYHKITISKKKISNFVLIGMTKYLPAMALAKILCDTYAHLTEIEIVPANYTVQRILNEFHSTQSNASSKACIAPLTFNLNCV